MIFVSSKYQSEDWLKYLLIALICALVSIDGISSALAQSNQTILQQEETDESNKEGTYKANPRLVIESDTVASHLGGYYGILAFLHDYAIPALLSDQEIAKFFGNLTITPVDLEQCLAMMLDHNLGGSSPHSGTVVDSGHKCRGSMAVIHKGRDIPDETITKFIHIITEQAKIAGVSHSDIKAITKVLELNRSGVRNK